MTLKSRLSDRTDAALRRRSEIAQTPPATASQETASAPLRRPLTSPGALMLTMPIVQAATDRAEAAEALLGKPLMLRISELVSAPGRRRSLSVEQFSNLVENLRHNPLVHPIVVWKRPDGPLEIKSGENRVAAYRELGRTEIEGFVQEEAGATVDRSAFYANLMQPELPDYEKYIGFKRELDRTGMTQEQVASQAGVAQSMVASLLVFDRLPVEVLLALTKNPHAIGRTGARKMVNAIDGGASAVACVNAISRLASGETEVEVLRLLTSQNAVKAPAPAKLRVVFRDGRSKRCEIVSDESALRLTFKNPEDRRWIHEEIERLLTTKYQRG
jgi:ParB family chromosome partitioning protein